MRLYQVQYKQKLAGLDLSFKIICVCNFFNCLSVLLYFYQGFAQQNKIIIISQSACSYTDILWLVADCLLPKLFYGIENHQVTD